MTRVSFLISTRGRNPRHLFDLLQDLENQSYSDVEVVVVLQPLNQSARQAVEEIVSVIKAVPVNLVVSDTIGLSKSRNIALSQAVGDILLLCDDDCRYPSDAAANIAEAMATYPDWDVIGFQMAETNSGKLHKRYPLHPQRHNLRSLMHINSVEITLRKHAVWKVKLFDERIGLGTPYMTGEENVMLVDLFRKGFKVGYFPRVVVFHPMESSGLGDCDLDQLVFSKGVVFRRMFGVLGVVPALIFFVRRLFPGKTLRLRLRQIRQLRQGLLEEL